MRSVTVKGTNVHVTDDPQRVLTQLLTCMMEEPSPRALEPRFASGGEGFVVANVVEARRASEASVPYREAPDGVAEPWIVSMHRGKGKPATLILDGTELRSLVHAALFPEGSAVALHNKRSGLLVFGVGGAVSVIAAVMMMQVADWVLAIPFGVFVGAVVGIRLAMFSHRLP